MLCFPTIAYDCTGFGFKYKHPDKVIFLSTKVYSKHMYVHVPVCLFSPTPKTIMNKIIKGEDGDFWIETVFLKYQK